MITTEQAKELIGKVVTYWDSDSQSYSQGKLLDVDADNGAVSIECGKSVHYSNYEDVHVGTIEERDGSYMVDEDPNIDDYDLPPDDDDDALLDDDLDEDFGDYDDDVPV